MIAKSTLGALTVYDCIGAVALLAFTLGQKVIEHLFPKRPDLYQDVLAIQNELQSMIKKVDVVESDVTAMRMANSRAR